MSCVKVCKQHCVDRARDIQSFTNQLFFRINYSVPLHNAPAELGVLLPRQQHRITITYLIIDTVMNKSRCEHKVVKY